MRTAARTVAKKVGVGAVKRPGVLSYFKLFLRETLPRAIGDLMFE
jgi:hypothetical protein